MSSSRVDRRPKSVSKDVYLAMKVGRMKPSIPVRSTWPAVFRPWCALKPVLDSAYPLINGPIAPLINVVDCASRFAGRDESFQHSRKGRSKVLVFPHREIELRESNGNLAGSKSARARGLQDCSNRICEPAEVELQNPNGLLSVINEGSKCRQATLLLRDSDVELLPSLEEFHKLHT